MSSENSKSYVDLVRAAGHIRSERDLELVLQQRKVRAHGLTPPPNDVPPAVNVLRTAHGSKKNRAICANCGYRIKSPGHLKGIHHRNPRKDK